MKIYLKTILTNEAELIYILSQIMELKNIVDKFLIVEPGFTHTGDYRDFIGIDRILQKVGNLSSKIDYIPIPMNKKIKTAKNSEHSAHENEKITRGCFVDYLKFNGGDLIISTDADEVIYKEVILKIIKSKKFKINPFYACSLQLNQLMYNDGLIAKEHKFIGPSVIKFRRSFFNKGYYNWRYAGFEYEEIGGFHFSWCFPIDDLVKKVQAFAHGPSYFVSENDARSKIENDIEKMQYSFRSEKIILSKFSETKLEYPNGYIEAKKIWSYK